MFRPPVFLPLSLAAALLAGGCSTSLVTSDNLFGIIRPYRIEVVQGNVVTEEQLALLKPGMTRNQVRDVLGSPLLTDPFHAERWDYIFTIRRPGTEPQRRSVIVRFEGEGMKSVEAPDLPTEREFVASITRQRDLPQVKLELTDEERKALPPPPPRAAASAPEPTGATRSFPPLEAS